MAIRWLSQVVRSKSHTSPEKPGACVIAAMAAAQSMPMDVASMLLGSSVQLSHDAPEKPDCANRIACRQRADIWTAAEAVMCNGGSLETRTSHVQTASVKSAPPAAHSPPLWHGFGSHGCDGSNPHSSPEKPPMQ